MKIHAERNVYKMRKRLTQTLILTLASTLGFALLRAATAGAPTPAAVAPPESVEPVGMKQQDDLASATTAIPQSSIPQGWVLIASKGKCFEMGQEFVGHRWTYTYPVHPVSFTYDFLMSSTQVSQAEYMKIVGVNPSQHLGDDSRPVDNVSWIDAVLYCNAMSKRDSVPRVYNYTEVKRDVQGRVIALVGLWADVKNGGYRLLTSAEYEYVVRAGTTGRWFFTDKDEEQGKATDYAWCDRNSEHTTHPVAKLKANAFGVYDITGNLWMWCNDWYGGAYPSTPQTDPEGPATGEERVARGGAFKNDVNHERSAYHWQWQPETQSSEIGFRIARTVPSASPTPLRLLDINESAWYRIVARHSGKTLEIAGRSDNREAGAALQQSGATGADSQLFQFSHFQGAYYQIFVKSSGKVLQIKDNSMSDHASVEQSDPTGADNQLFTLVKDTDDSYSIVAKSSGYCFDVSGDVSDVGNNARVVVCPPDNALNHKFQLFEASLGNFEPVVVPFSVVPSYKPPFDAAAAGMTSLFDGKTLNGWVGDPACWKVIDGAIVGLGENQNLMTVGDYDDFRLIVSTIQVNSPTNHQGIGFWGEHMPPGEFGYGGCVDVMPPMYWTWDYKTGHEPRGSFRFSRNLDKDLGITRSEWTQAEILVNRSKGTIRMAINGIEMMYYTDWMPCHLKRGPIGLQAHRGNHDVRYKDIYIEVSPTKNNLITLKNE